VSKDSDAQTLYEAVAIAEGYPVRSPKWAAQYATRVLGHRWVAAEPQILTDPIAALRYAREVFEGEDWPEFEALYYQDPKSSYWYAQDIIKGRFRRAEPFIVKSPEWAYFYARIILGTPWPEAETMFLEERREGASENFGDKYFAVFPGRLP
jgi:hypothetical protein